MPQDACDRLQTEWLDQLRLVSYEVGAWGVAAVIIKWEGQVVSDVVRSGGSG